jgi:hypothetical protein
MAREPRATVRTAVQRFAAGEVRSSRKVLTKENGARLVPDAAELISTSVSSPRAPE